MKMLVAYGLGSNKGLSGFLPILHLVFDTSTVDIVKRKVKERKKERKKENCKPGRRYVNRM